jgi:hypothetical protein
VAKTATETTPITEITLSAATKRAIEAIKRPFNDVVKAGIVLDQKRRDLALPFMKAFGAWQSEMAENGHRVGFTDFVRMLHPELPQKRAEYRGHPVYNAALYLQRLGSGAAEQNRAGAGGNNQTEAERPAPPTDVIAMLLATVAQFVPAKQMATVFDSLKENAHWNDERITTIAKRMENVEALVDVKGRSLENLRLSIHVPEQVEETEQADEAEGGRRTRAAA